MNTQTTSTQTMKLKTKLTPKALKQAEEVYNLQFVDIYDESINIAEYETPEDIVIKRDNFTMLSTEAKEVINTVLDVPIDLFNLITTKHGNISKTQVKAYFKAKFGPKKSKEVFSELADYVNVF